MKVHPVPWQSDVFHCYHREGTAPLRLPEISPGTIAAACYITPASEPEEGKELPTVHICDKDRRVLCVLPYYIVSAGQSANTGFVRLFCLCRKRDQLASAPVIRLNIIYVMLGVADGLPIARQPDIPWLCVSVGMPRDGALLEQSLVKHDQEVQRLRRVVGRREAMDARQTFSVYRGELSSLWFPEEKMRPIMYESVAPRVARIRSPAQTLQLDLPTAGGELVPPIRFHHEGARDSSGAPLDLVKVKVAVWRREVDVNGRSTRKRMYMKAAPILRETPDGPPPPPAPVRALKRPVRPPRHRVLKPEARSPRLRSTSPPTRQLARPSKFPSQELPRFDRVSTTAISSERRIARGRIRGVKVLKARDRSTDARRLKKRVRVDVSGDQARHPTVRRQRQSRVVRSDTSPKQPTLPPVPHEALPTKLMTKPKKRRVLKKPVREPTPGAHSSRPTRLVKPFKGEAPAKNDGMVKVTKKVVFL